MKQKWVYKKNKMYVSSFHFVSLCFIMSCFKFFGLFHPVSEFFLYILIVSFVRKQKWAYKKNFLAKKSICFIVTFRFTLFRNNHRPRCLNSFILFCNKWNEWNWPSVRTAFGLFHLFHSVSAHFRVFLTGIYFNCFICFCYGEKNVPKKTCVVFVQYLLFHTLKVVPMTWNA